MFKNPNFNKSKFEKFIYYVCSTLQPRQKSCNTIKLFFKHSVQRNRILRNLHARTLFCKIVLIPLRFSGFHKQYPGTNILDNDQRWSKVLELHFLKKNLGTLDFLKNEYIILVYHN